MSKTILGVGAIAVATMIAGCQVQQPANPVAFVRLTGDYWQVWTMQPDGNTAVQVTTSPSDKRYPDWSSNGRDLFLRNNNNQAFTIDIAARSQEQILQEFGLIGGLAVSPDGTKLLFVRFRTDLKDSSDLWVSNLEGKDRRVIGREVGLYFDPAWSPDGKQIAYIFGYDYQTNELYIMDCDGQNKRKLTDNKTLEFLPAFSPDAKTIAYVSNVTGDYEIWLINTDGTTPKQLTHSEGMDTRPVWSPDGNKIMFASNRSGRLQIWTMNSDGSGLEQLTKGPACMDPAWRKESY